MRSAFIPPTRRDFDSVFLQVKGGGLDDISIFLPPALPRGRRGGGIFNILSGFARKALPFLMRSITPEVTRMGRDVIGDVLEGKRISDALKTRGVTALKGVARRVVRGGGKRKRGTKKKHTHTHQDRHKIRKRKPKRTVAKACYKSDIFNMKGLV